MSTDATAWASLMGRDLPRADLQPLQAAHVTRSGTLRIAWDTFRAAEFQAGERVGVALRDGRAVLGRQDDGLPIEKGKDASLPVSDEVASALGAGDAHGAIVVGGHGAVRILPVRVREHAPDVLGPRFVDDVRDDCIVRHAVPGPPHDGWTDDALAELEGLVCGEPFRTDPVAILAEGDDWVAWMTRNRVLALPAPDDQTLHQRLVGDVLQGQQPDGSWGAVPATAYAVLRLLALGVPPSDQGVQRAARWLLDLPEPPPRPGMWMLTDRYRDEWLARREPKDAALGACQIIHTPPDDAINFFSWRFPDAEQDQFRAQPCQRVVPTCARHHPPACEPRITHVSALVAEALLRCGFADHPRLRRYVHTAFHVGGPWGYWCGCGALGLYDPDIPADETPPDFDLRAASADGAVDLAPLRWVADAAECARLSRHHGGLGRGTHLEPFFWHRLPGDGGSFALLGTAWQNGDCCVKTNRALSQHPACPGSLTERQALYQIARYQSSLGEWDQGYPAGLLAWLSLYRHPAAKALVAKTVPWLRAHQADDGLWHHESLFRTDWGKPATPPEPRLATHHIVAALDAFGLLRSLRP